MNKSRARSAPPIRLRAPFITSASKPKRAANSVRKNFPAAGSVGARYIVPLHISRPYANWQRQSAQAGVPFDSAQDKPVLLVLNVELAAQISTNKIRWNARGRGRAGARGERPAARGKSRSDELAPGHGGLPARRFSRSAQAAAAASTEKAFLAPDPGSERSRSGGQRSTEGGVGSRLG